MAAGWISDAPSGPGLEIPWGGDSSSTPREEVFPGAVIACFLSGVQALGQSAPAVRSQAANWLQPLSAMLGRRMRAGWAAGHALSRPPEGRVHMPRVRVAAVQASYVLMDKQATLDKVAELTAKAAVQRSEEHNV